MIGKGRKLWMEWKEQNDKRKKGYAECEGEILRIYGILYCNIEDCEKNNEKLNTKQALHIEDKEIAYLRGIIRKIKIVIGVLKF